MKMQNILAPKKILEILTLSAIIVAVINCSFGLNFAVKIKNNQKKPKAYYLMDFQLLGHGFFGQERNSGNFERFEI
ncbi:MAG: hypothetical protein PHP17_07830 [Candidatus Omnitrophica bacterium]|nr:hypothetical protein [Candidatus Omnitrophota bacterium]